MPIGAYIGRLKLELSCLKLFSCLKETRYLLQAEGPLWSINSSFKPSYLKIYVCENKKYIKNMCVCFLQENYDFQVGPSGKAPLKEA